MRSILIQVLEVGDPKMQMQNRGAGLVSVFVLSGKLLKGVFAKNERGYRLNAIKKRF